MENIFRESGVKWLWEKIKTLLSAKQDKLVSGENIKTINGKSLLGSGDVSISGGSGGDFNESGTYPNLTAGNATKLATARTISLSGGARGSVSFDGSKNVDIPVTSINEGKMVWNDTYEKNKVSILDTLFCDSFGNKLAYLNPNAIKVEYSRDGGATWLDYGNAISGASELLSKTRLVTFQCGLGSYYQGKRTTNTEETYTDQLRITIDAIDGNVYFSIKKILIRTSAFVEADNKQVKIETQNYSSSSVDTGLWTTRGIYHIVGQPGWSAIPTTGWPNFGYAVSGHIRKVRFTFYQNALGKYRGSVDNIAFLAESVIVGGNTLTKTGHLYTMDAEQNAIFPAAVTATKHVTQGGTNQQVVLGDGTLKTLSEIGGSGEDSRYSQFIDVLNNSESCPIIPSEAFFGSATWVDIPEDNEATLDFYNEDAKTLFYDGEKWVEEGMAATALHIPYANSSTSGLMSAKDKIKLDGFDGFDTGKDYVGADVANGVYGRNNYIDLSGKGLNEGDIIIVTHKNGNYVAYAMLIWTDGGMLEIKSESTPATTISTQHPYIIFSSVQATDEITVRKIHTTRL